MGFFGLKIKMAGTTGLEPATSGVTGRRSNRTELRPRSGGRNRDRTCDLQLVRLALSQLSYPPTLTIGNIRNNLFDVNPIARIYYIVVTLKCQELET